MYAVDCYTISKVLTRFGYPVTPGELIPARGVTYLIMLLNYPASQAAFAYYLKRTRGVPIFEVLGIIFFIAFVDLYMMITLAFIGSFFQEAVIKNIDISQAVRNFALIAYCALIFNIAFWEGWFSKIFRTEKKFRITEWIRSKRVFCVFNDAELKDYFKIALLRSPLHFSIIFFLYIVFLAFHAHVPFINVLADVPIAFLVGTIPITPSGIGTTNYVITELLSPYVTGPLISAGVVTAGSVVFAMTILWMFVNFSLKALVGFGWLQRVSKQLFQSTEDVDASDAASEATHLMGDI